MGTEAALWNVIRKSKPYGHWERVENRVARGTPDVNFCLERGLEGWLELKAVPKWPVGSGPLRVAHFTKQQRWWLRERSSHGGRVGLLLRVDSGPREHLLLKGDFASAHLGESSRSFLIDNSWNCGLRKFDMLALEQGLRDYL